MSWNNGYERKKFERKLNKDIKEYKAAGMTDEQINAMIEFDEEVFRSERRYRMHNQEFSPSEFDDEDAGDEGQSTLYENFFENLTAELDDYRQAKGRYDWIETIDNPELYQWLKTLTSKEIEFLTLVAFDEISRKDAAERVNIRKRTMERMLENWRKNFFEKIS